MRGERDPLAAVVIEGVVQIKAGGRCRNADIDTLVGQELGHQVVDRRPQTLIDPSVRRGVVSLIIDDDQVLNVTDLLKQLPQIVAVLLAEDDVLVPLDLH